MVDVLMLASLGDTNLDELLALSQEYDVVRKAKTQSFFGDRTIYDATAFTQTYANGDESAYLGHVVVGPNGRLGFDPSVVLAGEVAGVSIHDFLAGEVAAHHDGSAIWANLLGGGDVVVGNGLGSYILGYDGNDILINVPTGGGPGRAPYLNGGSGDDLIVISDPYAYVDGGVGEDDFVFAAKGSFGQIEDFEHGLDRMLFDRTNFSEIGDRVTRSNFHVGASAGDADDRIIAYLQNPDTNPNVWQVFVDPDGIGGAAQQLVAYVFSDHKLTFRAFGTADAAKLVPDIADLFDRGTAIDRAFGPDHMGPHAALVHTDTTALVLHGLIQLA